MLSIKFDNSTTCKIDGWLRNTINNSKPAENQQDTDAKNINVPGVPSWNGSKPGMKDPGRKKDS